MVRIEQSDPQVQKAEVDQLAGGLCEHRRGRQEEPGSDDPRPVVPVRAEGDKLRKQDGTPIATVPDPETAADVAGRLNEDEGRREEDRWSA